MDEVQLAEMIESLRSARIAHVTHEASISRPAPFASRLPSGIHARREKFEKAFTGEPLAEMIRLLDLEGLPARLGTRAARACAENLLRHDRITVTFGEPDPDARAELDPVAGTIQLHGRDSPGLLVGLGARAAEWHALLAREMPEDKRLAELVPCEREAPLPQKVAAPTSPAGEPYAESLPEAVRKVAPDYPRVARKAGIDGTVLVQALVSRSGDVQRTIVLQSIPALDESAVRAVEDWKFRPARSGGVPVAVWVMIPIKFSLN